MLESIRAGKGIGDNLYLQSIARHLVEQGRRLEVCTDWPDIFRPIRDKVSIAPHRRINVSRVAHYTARKHIAETDQFQDCCITAGIRERVDLRLDWRPANGLLIGDLLAPGKPVVVVQMPRAPFGRLDGYGMELLPDCSTIQRAIDALAGKAVIVQVGHGKALHRFERVDIDLANRTSVADLLDVASLASGFLGYCSFIVPLAESFSAPALVVWSRRGLKSRDAYIRTITPKKILHRSSSRAVWDDCSDLDLSEAVYAFLDAIRNRQPLCW